MCDYALFTVGPVSLTGSGAVTGSVGTNSSVTLAGSTRITGNVACNGAVALTGSAGITGDVLTNGAINLAWSTHITGKASANSITCAAPSGSIGGTPTIGTGLGFYDANLAAMKPGTGSSVTVLKQSTYYDVTNPPGYNTTTHFAPGVTTPTGATLSEGNYSYDWQNRTIAAGTYYCPGKLTFSTSGSLTATGPVLIYSVGNVQLGGSGSLSGNFMIISEGNINIDGNAPAYNAVCIAGGTFTIGGSGRLRGAVISFTSVTTTISGAGFTYNKSTYDAFPTAEAGLTVLAPGGGSGNSDWAVTDDGAI